MGFLKDNGNMIASGFAKVCNVKCPKSLTSTRLAKLAATLSTVLNMKDTEMDQPANFVGHDVRIIRDFCQLPEKTPQLGKISKILMALMHDFHGKNLKLGKIQMVLFCLTFLFVFLFVLSHW